MRCSLAAPALAAFLLTASPGLAAPTCQDANGATARCGTVGAMPVGWSQSRDGAFDRVGDSDDGLTPRRLVGLVLAIGSIFALIALMPDFDGWAPGDGNLRDGDDSGL